MLNCLHLSKRDTHATTSSSKLLDRKLFRTRRRWCLSMMHDDVQGLGISVHVSSDYMKLVHFSRDVSLIRLIAECSTACTSSLPAPQLSHKTLPTRRRQNRQLWTKTKKSSKPLLPNPIFDIWSFQDLGSTTATSAMQIHPLWIINPTTPFALPCLALCSAAGRWIDRRTATNSTPLSSQTNPI